MSSKNNVLILGASSDMALSMARMLAKEGNNLTLAARDTSGIAADAEDIKIRFGSEVDLINFDVLAFEKHQEFFDNLNTKPDIVFCYIGYLGEQQLGQKDQQEMLKILNTNFVGCASILEIIANYFEEKKAGMIIGISSVAGDRGRKSNYLYGSAKAGFSAYLSGLRNRLAASNVHVVNVKPGFVATKMTENMDLPKLLTAKPDEVAKDVFKALKHKKNEIYTKWLWKHIMRIIKNIPEPIFKKMNL